MLKILIITITIIIITVIIIRILCNKGNTLNTVKFKNESLSSRTAQIDETGMTC